MSLGSVGDRHICEYKGCGRSFLRLDHLNRHKRNHDPQPKFVCEWPGCERFFSRSDVMQKHYKRHEIRAAKTNMPIPERPPKKKREYIRKTPETKFIKVDVEALGRVSKPTLELSGSSSKKRNQEVVKFNSAPILNEPVVSSEDLLQWLLQDFETIPLDQDVDAFFQPTVIPPTEVAAPEVSTQFPYSTDQTTINTDIMERLTECLPSIRYQEEFQQDRLEYYLQMYWTCYHSQFPVLNKPSFSTLEAHPILLLCMILVGASMSNSYQRTHSSRHLLFADSIAVPLRWLIYKNKEFKPPPQLWIVQALTMLESYEISSSSRDLHERANLHHGLTIQMLRRSPMFGGDPWMKYNYTTDNISAITVNANSDKETWFKWIEQESMKRTALFAFYLETLHAIVFGHEMMLALHDVKLSLPCDENLWQYGAWGFNTEYEIPLKFLGAIKKVIHRRVVLTGAFGKQMILSGLLSLFFQLDEKDFEFSISDWSNRKGQWKETIILAINFWSSDICPGGCCNINNSVCSELLPLSPQSFHREDLTCKTPLRHLYTSYTDLKHYDFMVYAGAPGRMNVNFSEKETEAVSARVTQWCDSVNARVAIVQIYLFLCEMLLSEDDGETDNIIYDPSTDCFPYRKHMLTHMLIILWCYNFCIGGPESQSYSEPSERIPEREAAHEYLKRIKNELESLTGLQFNSSASGQSVHVFAGSVLLVENKHHMVGIMREFNRRFETDHSEIAREHSRILGNCIRRSMGSHTVICEDMFEAAR